MSTQKDYRRLKAQAEKPRHARRKRSVRRAVNRLAGPRDAAVGFYPGLFRRDDAT